jgi:AcrR family transcriptional regulator
MAETTPRERRQQRTRQAILSAAVDLINEEGADKLSLREIARRIDYSPAGLYEYFGSKDEIIDAICLEGNRRLSEYLGAVPDTLPFEQYTLKLGRAYIEFARHNADYFQLIFSRLPSEIPDIPADYDLKNYVPPPEDNLGYAYNAVQMGMEAGEIAPPSDLNVLEIAITFWGLVHGLAMLQVTHLRGFPLDFEPIERFAIETFLRGLRTKD